MSDYISQMTVVIGSAPPDLVAFYQADNRPTYPASHINCLSFNDARRYTEQMHDIPVVAHLGLWILDDANDSNPFAYISKGPCAGMVIHFSHDQEPEIAFPSLSSFLAAMHDAGTCGLDIDKMTKPPISIPLDEVILDLVEQDAEDATFLITAYLPVTATLATETKDRLVSHEDFFVREAFAVFLSEKPTEGDMALAEQLATDVIPQVARAGNRAVASIKKVRQRG